MSNAKNFSNDIKAIIIDLLHSKGKNIPVIKQDTKLSDILDCIEVRRISFRIDDIYKINTHALVNTFTTFSDLSNATKSLINEKERKKIKTIYYNNALTNNINDTLVKICRRSFGKNIPEIKPDSQLRDIFDFINLRRIVFDIDNTFQINTHAYIDNMDTVSDLYNVVGNLVYTKTENMIKPILKKVFDSKDTVMPEITPDTNLRNILDYIGLRKLSFMIDEKFGINSHASIDNIIKMKDLCIIVDKLRSEKLIQKNQTITALKPKERMLKHQKELVLKDITKWLNDAWITPHENISFDSEIQMDIRLTDFNVFFAIEQKYNIELPYIFDMKTVGDLCEAIVKQRIKTLRTDKHIYNNSVNFEAAPVIMHQKPAVLERYGPYYYMKGHLPWWATLKDRKEFYHAIKNTMNQRFL